jgi:hypothetical protein
MNSRKILMLAGEHKSRRGRMPGIETVVKILGSSRRRATWLGIILLFLLIASRPVEAHTEGKMQLSAEPAGPFKMTVFTSPDPAEVGEIHIAALIFTADDASPVLDANVTVELAPLDGNGSTHSVQASLGDAENKLLFEAVSDVSEPGTYLVTVTIEDPTGQQGAASFDLEVTSSGGINWLYFIPVIGLGLVVLLWLYFRGRRVQTPTDPEQTDRA